MSETVPNVDSTVDTDASCCCFGCKSKWRIPLLILLMIVVAVVAGLFAGKDILKLRFSEPYKMASEAVQADQKVIEKLGEPLKVTGFPSGELNEGDCRLFFTVAGPNGEAAVAAQARTFDGIWAFNQLEVTFDDESKVSVETASEEGGLEEAPAWNP